LGTTLQESGPVRVLRRLIVKFDTDQDGHMCRADFEAFQHCLFSH